MQNELIQQAKALSKEERRKILTSFKEVEFHHYLKQLFIAMEPSYLVEITHGSNELGKDLVILKRDKFTIDVIGVVVKCGDIRAKTAGDVDELKSTIKGVLSSDARRSLQEIESQVEQALEHPAELKSTFPKLTVTKVFVVLVGDISVQVRRRLEKELQGNIEVFDIDRLIDNFTDYYPQIFFEATTIDFIQEQIKKLEVKHTLADGRKNLSEYFIEPLVAVIDIPVALDGEQLPLFIKEERIPFAKLRAVLKEHEQVIMVGDPGSGKSGVMAKIAIDLLQAGYKLVTRETASTQQKVNIPLLVTAKELLQSETIEDLRNTYFTNQFAQDRFVIQVLLVDALDEVPSASRKDVIEKAQNFSQTLSCSLMITSRKIDILKTSPKGFKKVELLPFEFGQACQLVQNLLSDTERFASIKTDLERIHLQIPLIPLALLLIVKLVEESKEVPASVTELYDQFHDIMLGRWDRQDKGIEVLFEYYIKKFFLASLAYNEFLKKRRLQIPKEEFVCAYEEYAKLYNWDTEKVEYFIKEIERAGILDIQATVTFRHRSFLDYFAAFFIHGQQDEFENLNDFLVEIYFDDMWGDTAFFYIGLKRKIGRQLLEKIFAFEGDGLSCLLDKLLCGKLLQAGWHSTAPIKTFGLEQAVAFAPKVRDRLLNIFERAVQQKQKFLILPEFLTDEDELRIPHIFADILVLMFSEFSFGSMVLLEEGKGLLNKQLEHITSENIYLILQYMCALHRFFETEELQGMMKSCLTAIDEFDEFGEQDRARTLVILLMLSGQNKKFGKQVMYRMKKLHRNNPEVFKQLLPKSPKTEVRIKKKKKPKSIGQPTLL